MAVTSSTLRTLALAVTLGLSAPALAAPEPASKPAVEPAVTEAPPANSRTSRPLQGIPIDFACSAELDPTHPLLQPQPGRDLFDFANEPIADPGSWLSSWLCRRVWRRLESAGAHRAPPGLPLPAVAHLSVQLDHAEFLSERTTQQLTAMLQGPLTIPHWSLSLTWTIHFILQVEGAGPLESLALGTSGEADHPDYGTLHLDELLEGSLLGAFRGLPRHLADDGGISNLLFSTVEAPDSGPPQLGAPADMDTSFWLLLAWAPQVRHAAMAFFLSSSRLEIEARKQLARWFALNDPNVDLRRDALAWLLGAHPEEGLVLEPSEAELVRWLLAMDGSTRMRSEVVRLVAGMGGGPVRDLLLLASKDPDLRVSDLAAVSLRRFPPPTAEELEAIDSSPVEPRLSPWTVALDARVLDRPSAERELVALAEAAQGAATAAWLGAWLNERTGPDENTTWVLDAWVRLASHPADSVRAAALHRFAREMQRLPVEAVVVARIGAERRAPLRARAIDLLDRPKAPGALTALLDAGRAESPEVRRAAAKALAMMADRESRALLDLLSDDPDRKVKRAARKSLRKRKRNERKAR